VDRTPSPGADLSLAPTLRNCASPFRKSDAEIAAILNAMWTTGRVLGEYAHLDALHWSGGRPTSP
jgi:hypothetical protein